MVASARALLLVVVCGSAKLHRFEKKRARKDVEQTEAEQVRREAVVGEGDAVARGAAQVFQTSEAQALSHEKSAAPARREVSHISPAGIGRATNVLSCVNGHTVIYEARGSAVSLVRAGEENRMN